MSKISKELVVERVGMRMDAVREHAIKSEYLQEELTKLEALILATILHTPEVE